MFCRKRIRRLTRFQSDFFGDSLRLGIAVNLGARLRRGDLDMGHIDGAWCVTCGNGTVVALGQKPAASEGKKQNNGDSQVDDKAGQEGGHLAQWEIGLRDYPVRDAAVDAYRREASTLRPVNDH
jgi:hypothetical protein